MATPHPPAHGSVPPDGTDNTQRPFVRMRRGLLASYLFLVLIIAATVTKISLDHRGNAYNDATQTNRLLARILEEHLARTFGEVDQALQAQVDHLVAQGGLVRIGEKAAHDLLAGRRTALPQAATFGLVLPDGRQFARASEYPTAPEEDMSEREDFIYLRAHAGAAPYLGAVAHHPSGAGQLIFISRRITLADGSFGGIVRCGIDTGYLARFYADLDLPPQTVVAVVRPDGMPIFQLPVLADLSHDAFSATAAFNDRQPAGQSGVFQRLAGDGVERLFAYHWLPDASLGVFVGLPLPQVYAESNRYVARIVASGLLVALVFGVFFRLTLRTLGAQETLGRQHRAAVQALRESEGKYRALVENIPQRVFYKDRQSRYIAANQRFAEDMRVSLEELIGRETQAFHPPEFGEKYAQDDRRVMESGQYEEFDEVFERDGKTLSIHTVKTPVRDETGTVIGICVIYWDITGQLELERRLKESEATLRAIFDNMQEGILVADAGGSRHYLANPAICRMLGYGEAELLAMRTTDMHPVEECARVKAIFANMSSGRFDLIEGLAFQRKDGSLIYLDASTTAISLFGRSCYVGVFRDVTEMRRTRAALTLSEARLREAQRLARIGNWELDVRNNSIFWSSEIYRIFELDPQKVSPSQDGFVRLIHPEDLEFVNRTYADSVLLKRPYDITHRLLMPDGRIKHIRQRGEILYDKEGKSLRSFGTAQDVTEQVLAEREIRILNNTLERRIAARTEELARANRELESFSYSVSHDLRAPLRAINGFSRILQDSSDFSLAGESRELLERIVRNTNRMGDLIDDILDYSRASQTALQRKDIDLDLLVRGVWEEQAQTYPNARLDAGPLGHVSADPATLRQVFGNLIGNALKYSSKRTAPQVGIGAIDGPEGKEIFVRDNGAGFDMQYAGKLFGMFQRMHADKEFPGTGVGLAIVKRIIERHGGRIWVEAVKDGGATFRFILPEQPVQT